MSQIKELAKKSLQEIPEAEGKMKALTPKKQWIEKVKQNPRKASFLYFEIFDNLVKYAGISDKDWEKLGLLLHFGVNPLLARNQDGLYPFEYFYKRNREERLSLHNLSKKHTYLTHKYDQYLESVANRLYYEFADSGFDKRQLEPIQKVQNLWRNYQRLTRKEADTPRVAFARLLRTTMYHPDDALSVDDLQQTVKSRLEQEKQDEKNAWNSWYQWEEQDYKARFHRPELGHARGHSPFYGQYTTGKDYLLYQPLPQTNQKALDDFLLSLKDLDASARNGLQAESVLPERRLKAYQRALRLSKLCKSK